MHFAVFFDRHALDDFHDALNSHEDGDGGKKGQMRAPKLFILEFHLVFEEHLAEVVQSAHRLYQNDRHADRDGRPESLHTHVPVLLNG